MLRAASSTVPHSTEKSMSRGRGRQISMTLAQSITPSPHAQPTAVPLTSPRSASDCSTVMSLACRWMSRSATCSSQAMGSCPER